MKYLFTRLIIVSATSFLGLSSLYANNLLEVYDLAVKNDPTLRAAKATYQANKEVLPQALANLVPKLDAKTTYVHNAQASTRFTNTHSYTLNLTQPIFHAEFLTGLTQAKQAKQQALLTLIAAEQDLFIRVSDIYFAILSAKNTLQAKSSLLIANKKAFDQAKHLLTSGLGTKYNLLDAQARHDRTYAEKISAQNELLNAYENLSVVIKIPISYIDGIPAHKEIPLLPPSPANINNWIHMAHCHNIEVQIAKMNAKLAKTNISTQLTRHLPTIDFQADIGASNSNNTKFYGFNDFTVSASLPLFQGGAVLSKTRQARALYRAADEQLELAQRTAENNTQQRYQAIMTTIDLIKALKQAAISTRASMEAYEAGVKVGTETVRDLLYKQSDFIDAETAYINTRYTYLIENLKLKRAAGIISICDLKKINALLESETDTYIVAETEKEHNKHNKKQKRIRTKNIY